MTHFNTPRKRQKTKVIWRLQGIWKCNIGLEWVNTFSNVVGNKAKGGISKRVFQEKKARHFAILPTMYYFQLWSSFVIVCYQQW